MGFNWIKNYMPRSLYGRALLILILPVVTLQLVVSVAFIQRHFDGVTSQMTRNVLAEVNYLVDRIDEEPDLASAQRLADELAPRLELAVFLPAPLRDGDLRKWYDLSGRTVIVTLRNRLPGITGIDLAQNSREVQMSLETVHGGMELRLPRSRVSASNPHQMFVIMLATGLAMTLISYVFLRNQLRPITRMAKAAEAFGKGENVRYRPAGASEVRSAGLAFLDMRARIERQIEQRTLMLSGVSHDLRTPLTRLKLAISMLEDEDEKEDMARDVVEMQRLVDEFLSFVRDDALDDMEVFNPLVLVREAVADAQRGGLNAELGDLADGPDAKMRPLAVRRALDNLIGNAVRYGTVARISVLRQGSQIIFRIEDNGPGIPEEQRKEALKPFVRLDPSRNQNARSGVGLGLAIAADIARKHGGSLRLGESTELGGLSVDLAIAS